MSVIQIAGWIADWPASPFASLALAPWDATSRADAILEEAITLLGEDYSIIAGVARHASATVEAGAVVKAPAIIGPGAFVAANAYLRNGVFLDRDCIVGPGCELKSTFMFARSKVAHLSFIGDSIIGAGANIEAGAMVANYRNEMEGKRILIRRGDEIIDTGVDKFGALIGDDVKIGANSVIAPGALLDKGTRIGRLARVDQHPHARA